MVKLTKEDKNKLGQILKELNEMRDVLKGGEGSGKKGHQTEAIGREITDADRKKYGKYSRYLGLTVPKLD